MIDCIGCLSGFCLLRHFFQELQCRSRFALCCLIIAAVGKLLLIGSRNDCKTCLKGKAEQNEKTSKRGTSMNAENVVLEKRLVSIRSSSSSKWHLSQLSTIAKHKVDSLSQLNSSTVVNPCLITTTFCRLPCFNINQTLLCLRRFLHLKCHHLSRHNHNSS